MKTKPLVFMGIISAAGLWAISAIAETTSELLIQGGDYRKALVDGGLAEDQIVQCKDGFSSAWWSCKNKAGGRDVLCRIKNRNQKLEIRSVQRLRVHPVGGYPVWATCSEIGVRPAERGCQITVKDCPFLEKARDDFPYQPKNALNIPIYKQITVYQNGFGDDPDVKVVAGEDGPDFTTFSAAVTNARGSLATLFPHSFSRVLATYPNLPVGMNPNLPVGMKQKFKTTLNFFDNNSCRKSKTKNFGTDDEETEFETVTSADNVTKEQCCTQQKVELPEGYVLESRQEYWNQFCTRRDRNYRYAGISYLKVTQSSKEHSPVVKKGKMVFPGVVANYFPPDGEVTPEYDVDDGGIFTGVVKPPTLTPGTPAPIVDILTGATPSPLAAP